VDWTVASIPRAKDFATAPASVSHIPQSAFPIPDLCVLADKGAEGVITTMGVNLFKILRHHGRERVPAGYEKFRRRGVFLGR